jgi:hypothetical protein
MPPEFEVRDEALAQLGLAVGQAHIDRALALARLAKAKEVVDAVLQNVTWLEDEQDGGRRVPVLAGDAIAVLQGVVTNL